MNTERKVQFARSLLAALDESILEIGGQMRAEQRDYGTDVVSMRHYELARKRDALAERREALRGAIAEYTLA